MIEDLESLCSTISDWHLRDRHRAALLLAFDRSEHGQIISAGLLRGDVRPSDLAVPLVSVLREYSPPGENLALDIALDALESLADRAFATEIKREVEE